MRTEARAVTPGELADQEAAAEVAAQVQLFTILLSKSSQVVVVVVVAGATRPVQVPQVLPQQEGQEALQDKGGLIVQLPMVPEPEQAAVVLLAASRTGTMH
jgi:hypothetical protein